MTKKQEEPLRGEKAYNAEKRRIAERNEAAYARGRAERAANQAAVMDQRRIAERRETAGLPANRR